MLRVCWGTARRLLETGSVRADFLFPATRTGGDGMCWSPISLRTWAPCVRPTRRSPNLFLAAAGAQPNSSRPRGRPRNKCASRRLAVARVRLHVGPRKLQSDQARRVARLRESPRPVLHAPAGFHTAQTGLEFGEEPQHVLGLQLLAQDRLAYSAGPKSRMFALHVGRCGTSNRRPKSSAPSSQ